MTTSMTPAEIETAKLIAEAAETSYKRAFPDAVHPQRVIDLYKQAFYYGFVRGVELHPELVKLNRKHSQEVSDGNVQSHGTSTGDIPGGELGN